MAGQPTDAERSPDFQEGFHTEYERPWLSRFHLLKERGYLLRPRYRPGWVPSWEGKTDVFELECEDGIHIQHEKVLDAQRIRDGQYIMIKEVECDSDEAKIACYLSSKELKDNIHNHSVPVLDVIPDVITSDMVLLVFPLLRRITYPPVASVTEALDLVHQTLEGLVFLHEHEVAHRDCAFGNIMMDGRALFPSQWHPQLANIDLQNKSHRTTKSRTDVGGVRYYFTDFGLSTKGEHLVTGLAGLEDAPELSDRIPYDPFKLDIYILGMMFQRKIIDEFYNAAILAPLVQRMTARDPGNRPSASEAQAIFRDLQLKLDIGPFSERLIQKPEGTVARAIGGSRYWLRGQWARFGSKPQLPPFE